MSEKINQAAYDHVESFVLGHTKEWERRLGIAHWEVRHIFLDTHYLEAPIQDDYLVTAITETRWNYAMAKIKWYLPAAIKHSDGVLEDTLVHELCHVLLAPEQALLEIKYESVLNDVENDDHDRYAAMFFERQELATELAARALLRAWQQ